MAVQEREAVARDQAVVDSYPKENYAWYVVIILMIVYVFSFIDRQILGLLVDPMKADLGVSDSEMSYLGGLSFAIFYTLFGIPMGRLADSKSRRGIIAIGLGAWSLMTAGCGIARTYWQLLFFRVGVGVGEATLSPSAYSLITDYFKPSRMALAISVYGAGIYIGSGLANLIGGYVIQYAATAEGTTLPIAGDVRPWQLVFFIIGLPGLLFTLALLTVKEPLRRGITKRRDGAASIPLREVFQYIKPNWRTFMAHNLGFSLLALVGYGGIFWIPSFFIRTFGWEAPFTGKAYGAAILVFGTSGIIYGGHLAGKLAAKGHKDSKMRVGMIAALCHLPFGLLFPLMPQDWLAFAVMCPAIFCLAMPFGVAPAAIQEMMPNQMRGQASAVYLFVVNLIGLGLGPTLVAWCTDYVFGDVAMVRYSLLIVGVGAGVAALVTLAWGLTHYRNSLDYRDGWHAQNS